MRKKGILVFMMFASSLSSLAWAVTVGPYNGQVLDAQTGAPVAGATVLVYWEKNVPYPSVSGTKATLIKPVYSVLMSVKLVYSDAIGKYSIPQVTDSDSGGSLASTNIIVYQRGYESDIKTMFHETAYSERQQDFKPNGITKLQRIPPKFDHRKHRASIKDALGRLRAYSDLLDKDPLSGKPVTVDKRTRELIESIPKVQRELLARTTWEERRYSTYNMTVAIQQFCGINDFYVAPGSRELKSEFITQYLQCTASILQELKNKDPWVQLDAAYKLGAIEARKAIPALLDLFKNSSDWRHIYVQQECVLSIGKAGGEHRKKSKLKGMVMQANGSVFIDSEPIDREAIVAALLKKADDPYLRKDIIRDLGWFNDGKAVKVIKDAMQDPDEEIRATAVIAYAHITDASGKKDEHPEDFRVVPAPTQQYLPRPISPAGATWKSSN